MSAPAVNVLHLVHRLDPGGVDRHVRDLHAGLAEYGFASHVSAYVPGDSPWRADAGFTALPLFEEPSGRKSPRGFLQSVGLLRRLIKRERVQILHMHSRYALLLGWCALLGRSAARLYTAHNQFENYRWLPWYPRSIVVPSTALRTHQARHMLLNPHAAISVVHHGIDLPPPASEGEPEACRARFAWVGRIEEEKGLGEVIDAVASLTAEGAAVHLDVIGDGSLRAPLEIRCAEEGLSDLVHFHGWKEDPWSHLRDLHEGMRCMLLFSASRLDSFGYVLLEALARAVPVIAGDLPVLDDLVRDGETGLRYDGRDPDALADAMRTAIGHPARMREMGERGRELVRTRFTRDRMLHETADVYRNLIK